MNKQQGYCEMCGREIQVNICCNGHECGCMGQPTEPPVCSEQCYDDFMSEEYRIKKAKEYQDRFKIIKTIKK